MLPDTSTPSITQLYTEITPSGSDEDAASNVASEPGNGGDGVTVHDGTGAMLEMIVDADRFAERPQGSVAVIKTSHS